MPAEHYGYPTRLEEVFQFEHAAFRRYLRIDTDRLMYPAEVLARQSSEMIESPIPLVAYAGGWAAAEVGLYRGRNFEVPDVYSVAGRKAHLDTAEFGWRAAIAGFERSRSETTNLKMRQAIYGMELRAKVALNCLPTMRLVAGWHAGEQPQNAEVATKIADTRQRLLKLGSLPLSLARTRDMRRIGVGIVYELTAALLFQRASPLAYAVLPASLRKDHHAAPNRRADLMLVGQPSDHRRIAVRVSYEAAHPARNITVSTYEDLRLHGMLEPTHMLRMMQREAEHQIPYEDQTILDEATDRLARRAQKFDTANTH